MEQRKHVEPTQEALLSFSKAAKYSKKSIVDLVELAYGGHLPAYSIDRKILFAKHDLDDLIKKEKEVTVHEQ